MANKVICCKLPHGLKMVLRVQVENKANRSGVSLIPDESHEPVTMNGYLTKDAMLNDSGYALTVVDGDFADAWFKQNQTLTPVKRGLILLAKDGNDAKSVSKDREKVKDGFAPVDPAKPAPGVKKMEDK